MQVKVLYDHGKIAFPIDVKLKHECFHVVVNVPDEEIVHSPVIKQHSKSIGAELNRILGKYRQGNPPCTAAEDKAIWHKHLVEKHT